MQIEIAPRLVVEYDRVGEGRPLLLLHAFPLGRKMWAPQLAALADEYSVIAPDARGFGGSSSFTSPASPSSIAQMAHDLNDFLDALDITEPIILCGLSMGGYTAQVFAHEYSQRLRALILCDTRAQADNEEARLAREANIKLVQQDGSGALASKMLPALVGKSTLRENAALGKQVLQWSSAQQPSNLAAALAALRDRADGTAWLSEIMAPTLLVFGEEDALAPSAVVSTLHENIVNARLVKIPRAGHLSNLEQPELFNATLGDFARSLD